MGLLHILVVADAPVILDIVLSGDGWLVSTADSVSAADLRLSQGHFDLILVDYQLPDGDGVSAARRWKENAGLVSLPIVLYSGAQHDGDMSVLADVIFKQNLPSGTSKDWGVVSSARPWLWPFSPRKFHPSGPWT